ncbi:MAG: Crp/Fnr family transcriptional regulator [Verrucomicrobia bacterium]|jgi:CRP-like cAMP-binding protein|nr:Crp/Fnr family transcriptional regulator [Verrucomicrobiota bacterium]
MVIEACKERLMVSNGGVVTTKAKADCKFNNTSPKRIFMETLKTSITQHPFFDGMKPEHLAMLAGGAKEISLAPGDVLFRQGEPASHFYLIESGSVVIESKRADGRAVPVQTLGEGEVLGWSWLFAPFSWHFQAHAVEPSRIIVLSGAHLMVTAERNHDFGYELMKRVTKIVVKRLQATRSLLLDRPVEGGKGG